MNRPQFFFDGVAWLLNKGKGVIVTYLDFCGVSDTSSHDIITSKLKRYDLALIIHESMKTRKLLQQPTVCMWLVVECSQCHFSIRSRCKRKTSTLMRMALCRALDVEDDLEQIAQMWGQFYFQSFQHSNSYFGCFHTSSNWLKSLAHSMIWQKRFMHKCFQNQAFVHLTSVAGF